VGDAGRYRATRISFERLCSTSRGGLRGDLARDTVRVMEKRFFEFLTHDERVDDKDGLVSLEYAARQPSLAEGNTR
jgi:hypothetical protein